MINNSITDKFLEGILTIRNQEFSEDTIQKVKLSLLDYIGVTLGGSQITHEKISKLKVLIGDNINDTLVIGESFKDSLQNAIFFNGINSHALELDDGSRYGVTHPGGPLFSALIPIAFKYNVDWNDFFLGVVTGYETILRISSAIQPSHYNRGYHPTATCTPLGVAIAICVMLNLPYHIIKNAFSYSCIAAGGSLKAIENTSQMKVINAARASELGYISFCVAQAGFTGPEDVLSGNTGFLNVMATSYNPDILFRKENEYLWIHRVYSKLYASCRHTHGAIEGILKLRSLIDVNVYDIHKIIIKIYKGIKGKHDIFDIYGEESAKMSIPYSMAAAYVYGNANDDVFKLSCINNPLVKYLIGITEIIEDEYITSLLPDKRATEVTIYLKDKRQYTQFIEYPIGEPENPVDYENLTQKFIYLVIKSGESKEYAEKIISSIFNEYPDLKDIYNILNLYKK